MLPNNRHYNFNAGPSALPLEVLQEAQAQLVNYKQNGLSVMEMSHRSAAYEAIHFEAIDSVRELLAVPEQYEILFLQGGASLQFSMVPQNFLRQSRPAQFILTGSWSEKALKEASLAGETSIAASTQEEQYKRIPALEDISIDADASYLHLTSNNTIYGTQWQDFPDSPQVPLIADMSSDMMSRPVDVSKFALIYAGAQKNLGPAGVTLVIIRKDLLEKENENTPAILRYSTHAKKDSLYHTPPTFSIYMLSLVMNWIKKQGGLAGVYDRNIEKAKYIYDVIDESDGFYQGHARAGDRSLMNITFNLQTEALEQQFLEEAKKQGFIGLNGHRSVGGCRASTYNAVPLESCQALASFMEKFQEDNR